MEGSAIVEMFERSVQMLGVKYKNYVGDADSNTYKTVVESKPYEDV